MVLLSPARLGGLVLTPLARVCFGTCYQHKGGKAIPGVSPEVFSPARDTQRSLVLPNWRAGMGPSEECHEQRAGASQHCYCHRGTKAPAGSVLGRGVWTVKAHKVHLPKRCSGLQGDSHSWKSSTGSRGAGNAAEKDSARTSRAVTQCLSNSGREKIPETAILRHNTDALKALGLLLSTPSERLCQQFCRQLCNTSLCFIRCLSLFEQCHQAWPRDLLRGMPGCRFCSGSTGHNTMGHETTGHETTRGETTAKATILCKRVFNATCSNLK